jgi:hypothetical protein
MSMVEECRGMVDPSQAEKAPALLTKTLIEDEQDTPPQPANVGFLEEGGDRKPRSYGLTGGYARIYLWSFSASWPSPLGSSCFSMAAE